MAWIAHLLAAALAVLALRWAQAGPAPHPWRLALAAACVLAAALVAFRASDPPAGYLFSDFLIAYYPAGRAVLDDPQRLYALLDKGVSGFVNLPGVAWLFAPLGALPPREAIAAFALLGVAACAAAWWLLCRVAGLDARASGWLAVLFAANGPLLYSLKEGNTSHLVLLGLVGALALLRAGRSLAAGALLGACAVIKPPLALYGFFFLLRRDVAGLAGFVSVGVGAGLASLALAGWALNAHWFEWSVLKFSSGWLAAYNVQSLPAFVLRLDPAAQAFLHDWAPVTGVTAIERLAVHLLRTAVLAAAAVAWYRGSVDSGDDPAMQQRRRDLQFLLVLCLALVASPLSWSHYYAWLLVPIAFLLGPESFATDRRTRLLGFAAVLLATLLVRPLVTEGPLLAAYRALGASHLLVAGLLVYGLVALRLAALSRWAGQTPAGHPVGFAAPGR